MANNILYIIFVLLHFKIIYNYELNDIADFGESNYYMTSSAINNKGDLIITSTPLRCEKKKYFYGRKKNGQPFFNDSFFMVRDIEPCHERWESSSFFINNSFISFSQNNIEIFNFNNNFYKNINKTQLFGEKIDSKRNSIIILNDNPKNYIFCYLSQDNLYLTKIFISDEYFTNYEVKNSTYSLSYNQSNMISCFATNDKYIICLYKNPNKKYEIIVFNDNLDFIGINAINYSYVKGDYEYVYGECIHFKNNIGAFAFFRSFFDEEIIFLLLKFDNGQKQNYMEDLDEIILNNSTHYDLNPRYNSNSLVKLSEEKLALISGGQNNSFILIILIELYNNDTNIFTKYYYIELYKTLNKYYFDSIRGMNYNGILAMGIAFKNKTDENEPTSQALIFFGYLNYTDNFVINRTFIKFDFPFRINESISNQEIRNNIFNYYLYKVKMLELPNPEETNIHFISIKKNSTIKINDSLDLDDIIYLTKLSKNKIIKFNKYNISSVLIYKEKDYNQSLESVNFTQNFGNDNFENFYKPKEYYGKTTYYFLNINETGCPKYISNNLSLCLDDIEDGFYSDENSYKQLFPCHEYCKTCNGSSKDDCITFKEEYNFSCNKNDFIFNKECYKNNCPENTKLNISSKYFKICICNYLYYITNKNNDIYYNCIPLDKCDNEHPFLNISNKLECKTCSNTSSEKVIFNYCASNFEDILEIYFSSINEDDNSKDDIIIDRLSDNNLFIHIYKLSSDIEKLTAKKDLIYIDLGSNNKELLKSFSSSSLDDNLFLILYENYTEKGINFFFEIYSNYTKNYIDLSLLNNNITLYYPIKNLTQYNYEYAELFSEQGYDIYNINSSFYNDDCSSAYINKNDIIIKDRKNEIYPQNSTICFKDCEYKGINLTTKNFICKCKVRSMYTYNNKNFENNEDKGNFFSYILDNLNIKIFKCFNLISIISNYNYNIGFFIGFITIFFNLVTSFMFFIITIKKIRILFYKDMPSFKTKKNFIKKKLVSNPLNKKINSKEMDLNNENNIDNENNNRNELPISVDNISIINYNNENNANNNNDTKNMNSIKNNDNNNFKVYNKSNLLNKDLITSENKIVRRKRTSRKAKTNLSKGNRNKNFSINKNINSINSNNRINPINNYLDLESKDDIMNLTFEHLSPIRKEVDKNDYNELPYITALLLDKRDSFKTFLSILFMRIKIIKIFFFHEEYSSIILDLNQLSFSILFEIFMNAILFSDGIISKKYHSNGKLDKITIILLAFISMIISNIFEFLVDKLSDYNFYISILIKDVKNEEIFLYYVDKIITYMKIKISIYFIFQNIISIVIIYYLFLFCAIYFNSQINFISNYFYGILESLLLNIIISLIVCMLRKIGLLNRNKLLYNTSKYINRKL